MKTLLHVHGGEPARLSSMSERLVRKLKQYGLHLGEEVRVLRTAPLIFGLFRKEFSLVMLSQALGTVDFGSALTSTQMIVFATFVMFYLPCLATLSALKRELGARAMIVIEALTVVIALVSAVLIRGVGLLM